MHTVNLEQPAKVFWWANGRLPALGSFAWGSSDRDFLRLCEAIHFVLDELSASERSTALILFDAPSGTLDFREPGVVELARIIILTRELTQYLQS
jgi:hypothetical protein